MSSPSWQTTVVDLKKKQVLPVKTFSDSSPHPLRHRPPASRSICVGGCWNLATIQMSKTFSGKNSSASSPPPSKIKTDSQKE
ncbi:hypothetical protein I307_00489 [Cryptococcus deuterogattii 99/473]|uniref:Unplaced genomic scaffold supercont1.4, whole genome shotgun sequence n=1 Tax=Cryptococcus deuterogattii Ram5 TaxID=1296110 RepID=A0A0D0U0V9_9TREE|nr:hypothetical protein I309_02938 [Cryptococcus deuterogattii LA55]KIR41843.1 hypothetical protein I313_02003 [Cryptococcus deuterogattii Ram5]KIR73332.1 hypothetical protein I310_02998 [Cryptococcus deuterogattii CA1014]KIR91667.1 hypothetical protein I304_04491 [Cryptococcus deuterogattii CBS 10090]KIR99088.1 hypothetical protein L804_03710 [Cryptococcus deuterogattii 2001/935-1]KIY60043.1 hypothetical protein I307_00489 [Cryptococcus deuterogattii 99/473]